MMGMLLVVKEVREMAKEIKINVCNYIGEYDKCPDRKIHPDIFRPCKFLGSIAFHDYFNCTHPNPTELIKEKIAPPKN